MARTINNFYNSGIPNIDKYVIVAHPHARVVAVMPYLPKTKFWFPYLNDYATFYKHGAALENDAQMSPYEVIILSGRHFKSLDFTLFLFDKPLLLPPNAPVTAKLIYGTDMLVHGTMQEKFYLYTVIPK